MTLRLAHHSSENEQEDINITKERLARGKKVEIFMEGLQDEVRSAIGVLFGNKTMTHMQLVTEDSITLSQKWRCTLHMHEYEKEIFKKKQQESKEESPGTPEEFVDIIHEVFENYEINSDTISQLSRGIEKKWKKIVEEFLKSDNEGALMNDFGRLAQHMFAEIIKERLNYFTPFADVVNLHDRYPISTSHRMQPNQERYEVLFMRKIGRSWGAMMEVDLLYRLRNGKGYVAIDVTTKRNKQLKLKEKTETLQELSDQLRSSILLINIPLLPGAYQFKQLSPHIYRMRLACSDSIGSLLHQSFTKENSES